MLLQEEYITAQYKRGLCSKSEKAVKKGQKIQDAHRSDPSYRHQPYTGCTEGISFKRSVQTVSAYLETFGPAEWLPAKIRNNICKEVQEPVFIVSASKIIFDLDLCLYTQMKTKKGNVLNQSLERG